MVKIKIFDASNALGVNPTGDVEAAVNDFIASIPEDRLVDVRFYLSAAERGETNVLKNFIGVVLYRA